MNGNNRSQAQLARSAHQLCSFWDSDFVRSAYLTLLGREADLEGERQFTVQLRSGDAKTRILLALHSSEEARGNPIKLPGLQRRLVIARLLSLPFVARLANLWTGEYSNSGRARARRRLENDVARLRRDGEVTATSVARLTERVDRLIARTNAFELARKVNSVKSESVLTVEQILDLAE
ncbi:MAG: DUF4214 domain-containing protein [Sphingomonas sp.]|uniref:DUF4214 domain-containing protein n=1 Tax=Sphingomonas sp. TaxID=28214 RepID=UPI0018435C77|nr:DUF4214 domain-containing protein [Sphingomonas sp.]MBA3668066.1 DUF4214 domain-containing protein [Sphingomonas sp.]